MGPPGDTNWQRELVGPPLGSMLTAIVNLRTSSHLASISVVFMTVTIFTSTSGASR